MPMLCTKAAASAGGFGFCTSSESIGQAIFEFSTTWVCPSNITSVCLLAIGGGGGGNTSPLLNSFGGSGGGGGALAYVNNVPVTPGLTYTITVGRRGTFSTFTTSGVDGGDSFVTGPDSVILVRANGGKTPPRSDGVAGGSPELGGAGGGVIVGTGGAGGSGGNRSALQGFSGGGAGGGGAGGYSGAGGAGGTRNIQNNGAAGTGGAAGGGAAGSSSTDVTVAYLQGGGGGGGVGMFGQGASGGTASFALRQGGRGGSGGLTANNTVPGGSNGTDGAEYGGGGGAAGGFFQLPSGNDSANGTPGYGKEGIVRIIWGPGRAFPSTNTGNF